MIEALVIGRVGVDFTPASPRTTLAAADTFIRAVGGFAGNIGTGLARLGIRTALVSAVGDDGHGDHVRTFLGGEGIDADWIVTRPGSRTQVAFFEVWPPEHFPVTFYRPAPAPETRLTSRRPPDGSPRARPACHRVRIAPRERACAFDGAPDPRRSPGVAGSAARLHDDP